MGKSIIQFYLPVDFIRLGIQTNLLTATFSTEQSPARHHFYHQLLVINLFVHLVGGGASEIQRVNIDEVIKKIYKISEAVWNLMTLKRKDKIFLMKWKPIVFYMVCPLVRMFY